MSPELDILNGAFMYDVEWITAEVPGFGQGHFGKMSFDPVV